MYDAIQYILTSIYENIVTPIYDWIQEYSTLDYVTSINPDGSQNWGNILNESIIKGDLLYIPFSFNFVLDTILPLTILTILIVLFIKFVVKLLGIFSWK